MKNWKVELTVGGKNFAKEIIQKGIFQVDALLQLLFVRALMPLQKESEFLEQRKITDT